jgi:acetylornithine deacetylase/succinyl-diaminopimelate desuccinylase-like protein
MKTIIPNEATAKLDMRLVPDQDPDEIFELVEDHVETEHPDVAVEKMGTFPPMKTPVDTPAADVILDSLSEVWDADPVEMPLLGGSLPAAHFREELDVPVLVVPYANPDQGNHSPNEHLDVDCFRNGIETTARFLTKYGADATAGNRSDAEGT